MNIGGRKFRAGGRPHVVGVVNLSPESPNQDSIALDCEAAVERARRLAQHGAAIIDVGAQSSYFQAPLLPVDEEAARLLPVVRSLKAEGFLVSVDTFRPEAAQAAIEEGADVINDSDGFQDPEMVRVLQRWGGPVIVPFISGASPHDPVPFNFDDPMADVAPFLRSVANRFREAGLPDLILDPGTGYRYPGVTPADKERYQLRVYHALPVLRQLGHPLLVALPRKEDPARTIELIRIIAEHADFVRAHDPTALMQALQAS